VAPGQTIYDQAIIPLSVPSDGLQESRAMVLASLAPGLKETSYSGHASKVGFRLSPSFDAAANRPVPSLSKQPVSRRLTPAICLYRRRPPAIPCRSCATVPFAVALATEAMT
jgi:hypothetical protein